MRKRRNSYTGRWVWSGSVPPVQLHCPRRTGNGLPRNETRCLRVAAHRSPPTPTSGTTAQSARDFRSRDTPAWRHHPQPRWRQHTTARLWSSEELNDTNNHRALTLWPRASRVLKFTCLFCWFADGHSVSQTYSRIDSHDALRRKSK